MNNRAKEYTDSFYMIASEMLDQFRMVNNRLVDIMTGEIVANVKHILRYMELINKEK